MYRLGAYRRNAGILGAYQGTPDPFAQQNRVATLQPNPNIGAASATAPASGLSSLFVLPWWAWALGTWALFSGSKRRR